MGKKDPKVCYSRIPKTGFQMYSIILQEVVFAFDDISTMEYLQIKCKDSEHFDDSSGIFMYIQYSQEHKHFAIRTKTQSLLEIMDVNAVFFLTTFCIISSMTIVTAKR